MTDRITLRITPELQEAFERFIADGHVPLTSKQDAFGHILRDWLIAHGYIDQPPGANATN
jgi:hypothetical protein